MGSSMIGLEAALGETLEGKLGAPQAIAQSSPPPISATPAKIDPAFPEAVQNAVLEAATQQTGLKPDQLVLSKAIPKVWSDGCLGLGNAGQMCTAVLVRGWEVTLTHQRQEWVYRTNSSGSALRLDVAGGRLGRVIAPPATQIPLNEPLLTRSQTFDKKAVFQEIRTGGFAGITQTTTLHKDGRIVQTGPSTTDQRILRNLSQREVKAFQKQIEKLKFGQFNGLRYAGPQGAADFFRITLTNGQTTVQYDDLELEDLPQDLQAVIQAWQGQSGLP
ncbi:MAG: hypothetical protein MH252_22120 [Thermosynechococcaceae cyanobacterium MS004]|nr:hypothetical protein [Thermosynechococcaceae cyanobacterium MS004]